MRIKFNYLALPFPRYDGLQNLTSGQRILKKGHIEEKDFSRRDNVMWH